jgi:hypothetical protein
MSRNSKAYKCQAQQSLFICFPKTKIKQLWSLNTFNFNKAASGSHESKAVCKNVPSPSDLQWIPSNNQELISVNPETSGQNQVRHASGNFSHQPSTIDTLARQIALFTSSEKYNLESNFFGFPIRIDAILMQSIYLRYCKVTIHMKQGFFRMRRHIFAFATCHIASHFLTFLDQQMRQPW